MAESFKKKFSKVFNLVASRDTLDAGVKGAKTGLKVASTAKEAQRFAALAPLAVLAGGHATALIVGGTIAFFVLKEIFKKAHDARTAETPSTPPPSYDGPDVPNLAIP